MERCHWTQEQNEAVLSFLLHQKIKKQIILFVDNYVEERRNKFSRDNFNPSVVNFKNCVHNNSPVRGNVAWDGSFHFTGKNVWKYERFPVRMCNNLIGWNDRNFDPWRRCIERKSTEFVGRKWLRARRRSKFKLSSERNVVFVNILKDHMCLSTNKSFIAQILVGE